MDTTSTREYKIKQLEDENTLLRAFVEEVRDTALSFITTATGSYRGNETTEYCEGYFKEKAEHLLMKLQETPNV